MAVKAAASDFRSILTEIRNGKFAPVYILWGEEAYYIDKLTEALEEYVVAEDEKDFNFTVFYGQEADIPSVTAACQQYPFMSDRKIVLLKEAQSMDRAKNKLDSMADYMLKPNTSNVLVITYKCKNRDDKLAMTSPFMKNAKKGGAVIFNSPKLYDYQLTAPIKEYCSSKHYVIDDKALTLLVEYIGADLSKIFGEINKLAVASGEKNVKITPELIERNIGISKDFNNFELQNALANKNYDKSMRIVKYFESNPKSNPTAITTGTLFSFYSKLISAHFAGDKSDSAIGAAIGSSNAYQIRDMKAAMMKYSARQALQAIHLLRQFDLQSKGIGSFQNEYSLLRELIYNIFTAK